MMPSKTDADRDAILTALSRELTDQGKLIEAGWIGLQLAAIPDGASRLQLTEMRMAFFAGAQHLFFSFMTILEPGTEATDADLSRVSLIHDELENFAKDFARHIAERAGN